MDTPSFVSLDPASWQASESGGEERQTKDRETLSKPGTGPRPVCVCRSCVRLFPDFPDNKITGDTYSNSKFFKNICFVLFLKKQKVSQNLQERSWRGDSLHPPRGPGDLTITRVWKDLPQGRVLAQDRMVGYSGLTGLQLSTFTCSVVLG